VYVQVDTLLSEAELEAEIAAVKQRLTVRQMQSLVVNTDTVHGNYGIAKYCNIAVTL